MTTLRNHLIQKWDAAIAAGDLDKAEAVMNMIITLDKSDASAAAATVAEKSAAFDRAMRRRQVELDREMAKIEERVRDSRDRFRRRQEAHDLEFGLWVGAGLAAAVAVSFACAAIEASASRAGFDGSMIDISVD